MNQHQRMEKLKQFLREKPQDPLALYALAMEYQSLGQWPEALEYFDRLLRVDADYVAAYYQKAMVHLKLSDVEQARLTLQAGIPRAVNAGQLHARDKMRELLETLDQPNNP